VFKLRILFAVHQFFPLWYTGTERFVLNLAKQFQRMGHCVEVLTYGWRDDSGFVPYKGILVKHYRYEGIPVIAIKHQETQSGEPVSFRIFDERLEPALESIIVKEKYDIVHVAHPFRCGSSCLHVASSKRIPVLLTLTDFWAICPNIIAVTNNGQLCCSPEGGKKCITDCFQDTDKEILLKRVEDINQMFGMADYCTTSTYFLKKIIHSNYPLYKINVIRFGKNYSDIRKNSRVYLKDSHIAVGFLSTLQPHKGAHILIDAFNKIQQDNISLKIYGHYFDHYEYYQLLKKSASQKKVQFYDAYKYEDFQQMLDDLDIVVVPSIWWENSPLVLLRSLAHKVPVIVSDLEGMTEIIKEGENGFVFDVGNADSLANILKKIAQDPSILNRIKNNIISPPRIEEEAFEYECIYKEILFKNHSDSTQYSDCESIGTEESDASNPTKETN
jgi:glycosyltransferase involved in cell wall biosynthesis